MFRVSLILLLSSFAAALRADSPVNVRVDPPTITLSGPRSAYTILVSGTMPDGGVMDLTRGARYRSANPKVAAVSAAGVVRGVADGKTQIAVDVAGQRRTVDVAVRESSRPHVYHFENDIVPLLSRFGCNSSGCHGNAEGQNGFKLSVFGSD